MAESTRTPQEVNAEILSRLDVAAEYEALGVRLRGHPRASGMVAAFAYGRDDRSPSAWINIRSGCYGDSGGRDAAAYTMSLWDFAVKVGRFPDWKTARKAYAEKVGVTIGREKTRDKNVTDWRERLELQSWDTVGNDILAGRWCAVAKPGVTARGRCWRARVRRLWVQVCGGNRIRAMLHDSLRGSRVEARRRPHVSAVRALRSNFDH